MMQAANSKLHNSGELMIVLSVRDHSTSDRVDERCLRSLAASLSMSVAANTLADADQKEDKDGTGDTSAESSMHHHVHHPLLVPFFHLFGVVRTDVIIKETWVECFCRERKHGELWLAVMIVAMFVRHFDVRRNDLDRLAHHHKAIM
eukprot:CAMPEP_0181335638 /NCGR_PEP_ID=MMETSP1101-20121128/26950_1 /TAXON_ID=46948 /ORGANISM="Rhodomonas abbreviata, Strain Caron Lab Isolate" /LENGTH=146 /DNA_ID=CAMNT_0023445795 /DNA_START=59 /DNA_END=500 /DNA_ORIENTATION=-